MLSRVLFHNFSFDSNVMKHRLDASVTNAQDMTTGPSLQPNALVNQYNVSNLTQEFMPGFDHAFLYNSHQCSGVIHFQYLENIRKNKSFLIL